LVRVGRPVELDAHLDRLDASLRALFGAGAPAGARELVLDRARGEDLARLRLTVAPDDRRALRAEIAVAPVDPSLVLPGFNRAVELAPLLVAGGIGRHKWADRSLLAEAEAELAPRVPLLVDQDGSVLEASRGNLFLVRDGVLVTPPTDGRILPGVTRWRVLQLAAALDIPLREEAIALERLADAAEVFVTGAVRGIEPVRGCDGILFGREGPTTAALAREVSGHWALDDHVPRRGGVDDVTVE
jgi:para-aminobenzoate synthetase/4-amino-4-deoxychorismate lyase